MAKQPKVHLLYASTYRFGSVVACSVKVDGENKTFDPDLVTCSACRHGGWKSLDACNALDEMAKQYSNAERMERLAIELKRRIAEEIEAHKRRKSSTIKPNKGE